MYNQKFRLQETKVKIKIETKNRTQNPRGRRVQSIVVLLEK